VKTLSPPRAFKPYLPHNFNEIASKKPPMPRPPRRYYYRPRFGQHQSPFVVMPHALASFVEPPTTHNFPKLLHYRAEANGQARHTSLQISLHRHRVLLG
jgi:hypothetical protein